MSALTTRRVAVVATLAIAANTALASPVEDPALTGGTLFAGPTRPHGTSIYINPAALGLASRGQHVLLLSSLRVSQIWVDRRFVDESGDLAGAGPRVSDATPIPGGMLSWDLPVSDIARLGVALSAPLAERFASNRDALRYHTLGGHLYQFTGTAGASFKLANRFHLGLALSLGYTSLNLRYARDTAIAAGSSGDRGINSDCLGQRCGLENPAADQVISLETNTGGVGQLFSSKNIGLTIGGLYRIKDNWWLALSILSLPGAATIGGDLDLPGDVQVTEAPRDGGGELQGKAEILFRTTQSVILGVRGPILPRFDLVVTARWINWSRHADLDQRSFGGDLASGGAPVDDVETRFRGFRDVFSLDGGLESAGSERFRYGGRLRVESGAVSPQRVTPLQPEGLNLTALFGGEMRLGDHLVVGGTYGLTWFPTVDSRTSQFSPAERINCVDQEFAFEACEALRDGRGLPTAAGRYRRLQHSFVLSLRYDSL